MAQMIVGPHQIPFNHHEIPMKSLFLMIKQSPMNHHQITTDYSKSPLNHPKVTLKSHEISLKLPWNHPI